MRLRIFIFSLCACFSSLKAEDGYRLWMRYELIQNQELKAHYEKQVKHIILESESGKESSIILNARNELNRGIHGLLGISPEIEIRAHAYNSHLGDEGYEFAMDSTAIRVLANSDQGLLYGSFALLRALQQEEMLEHLALRSVPSIKLRLLNHWDNLNGTIERGYAGRSLWKWDELPSKVSERYRDYARACASIGINGVVINNVNADARIFTPDYITKVAAIADVLRSYGIRVYLSARFSSPIETGGLKTADPLSPEVAAWWRSEVNEIYKAIPDLGGFLVKANSEGQPGPQNYGRTHADGANVLADAVKSHGGIVIWRAFVYESRPGEDRVKMAYNEFVRLDGKFRSNVVLQIKNGAFDFQPREPFHPLFGAIPKTTIGLEVQITQEYLGQNKDIAFLAPMWREVLDSDTYRPRIGATVARILDGSLSDNKLSLMAGVANTGDDRNWTGHPLAQANWYAFGRLAWDDQLSAKSIAEEWTKLTFGTQPYMVATITSILLNSREAVVNYMDSLGLSGIFYKNHHFGPEPWLAEGRPDWTSVYYHRADAKGIGFDRSKTGSNAVHQYAPELAKLFGSAESCPEKYLLWFNHVSWDYRLKSGNTVWDEFCLNYQKGVDEVRLWRKNWETLKPVIDPERFHVVRNLLARQELDALWWRDTCILYFQTFSKKPIPLGVESPLHDLNYYQTHELRLVQTPQLP
jgi:alpha-glucuronidase